MKTLFFYIYGVKRGFFCRVAYSMFELIGNVIQYYI